MPVVALYDANVLYPSTLRDVLIRVSMARLVRARWTERILDETFRNLGANRPDLSRAQLDRTHSAPTASRRSTRTHSSAGWWTEIARR